MWEVEILTQINSRRLMTKQSWTERSLFPVFKLCVLLLKLDWNRSTKIAVDSNCWLEAQGQWSSAFRLSGSSKVALTSVAPILMLDPFSDNLALTWEILSVMPKPSWQTGETKGILCSLLVIVCTGWFPAVCSLQSPHTICQVFLLQVLGLNTWRTSGI